VLVLATSREDLRARWWALVATGDAPVATVSDWSALVAALAAARARVVLLDPQLPGLEAGLILPLAASLAHRPLVRVIDGTLQGAATIPPRPSAVAPLLRRLRQAGHDDWRARLRWCGLGDRALHEVTAAAAHDRPLVIVGERGTGKEFVARAVHALSRPDAPFLVLGPEANIPADAVGTVYVENAHLAQGLADRVQGRHRLACGARAEPALGTLPGAEVLRLLPLRERPQHLLPLVHHYLALHARRVGGSRRRFDRSLMALLAAWSWPGNERELEHFVVDVLESMPGTLLRGRDLPEALRSRLDPAAGVAGLGLEGFEEVVAARLAPVVEHWHEGRGTDLHALVTGACERALLRLALARTHGNRKATARLLGMARNTLQSDLRRLGVSAAPGSPPEDPESAR